MPKTPDLPKIKPNGPRVFAKMIADEEKTPGGLFIPETVRERAKTFSQAEVISVGDGDLAIDGRRIPTGFEPGQTVIFAKFGGFHIDIGGTEFVLLEAREILGTVQITN